MLRDADITHHTSSTSTRSRRTRLSVGALFSTLAVLVAIPVGATNIATAPRSSSEPVAVLKVSTVTVGVLGGQVRVTALVKNASTCSFSAPAKAKLSSKTSIDCSSGWATETVTLPKNSSAKVQPYAVTVDANSHSTKKTAHASVVLKVASDRIGCTKGPEANHNYSNCNFAGADLKGADLSKADLTDAI